MAEIFIVEEENKSYFENKDSYISIIYPPDENLLEDYQIHDWVVKIFKEYSPTSLVIPLTIRDDRFLGLMIGMHIRLNHELGHSQKAIPLFFLSEEFNYESIFSDIDLEIKKNRALPHYLLTTPNVYLERPDLEVIRKAVSITRPMTIHDYMNKFLNGIKINPSEATGKHSIANIWGAFKLAKTTGHTQELSKNSKLLQYQKDLYFKYIRAQSLTIEEQDAGRGSQVTGHEEHLAPTITIESTDKKILYIDDEANKGWDVVLRTIFKGATFDVVGKDFNENFSSFYSRAATKALEINSENLPKWDLILLDLRLNESEDLGDNANKKAQDFSGADLLKKIKQANKGTQVIMFTASNKAWNMRDLMSPNMGANGFFIKEAPEYNQDPSFSFRNYENFEQQIVECYEKKSLRKLCSLNNSIKEVLDLQDKLYDRTLSGKRKLIRAYLTLAFNSAADFTSKHKEHALYSFLQYYKIVEVLGKELIEETNTEDRPAKYIIKGRANKKIEFITLSPTVKSEVEPIKEGKRNIVGYRKSEFYPSKEDISYYTKPTSSLRFSGLMILRFAFDESRVNTFLKLNKLRNSVVAHSSGYTDEEVGIEDVLELAEILKESFQRL